MGPIGKTGESNSLNFDMTDVDCIGNYGNYTSEPPPADLNSSNSISVPDPTIANPLNRKWKYCKPLYRIIDSSNANNFIANNNIISGESFRETNNATSSNNFVPVPPYNFYSTLSRGGTEFLQDPIQVRVTRPIVANNAGGAGYFAGTSQTVDMDIIAKDFLDQLKAANFNTGKAAITNGSSSSFDLKNIT